MKVLVFGATGGTGQEIVQQSLENGYMVTAFVRDPNQIIIEHENLNLVQGDVFDAKSVANAIQDQDGVFCVLGTGSDLSFSEVRTVGTKNIIDGMQMYGVKRLVAVTFMGAGDSWNRVPGILKVLMRTLLKNRLADHESQEAVIRESDMDWTIVRPSRLTDQKYSGRYLFGEDISGKSLSICRADVADYSLKALTDNTLVKKTISVTN